MGITIHFSGELKNKDALQEVIKIGEEYASRNKWNVELINEKSKKLERVKNGKDWDYIGPTKGIVLYPHINCEPIYLEFDKDFYIQEYCKTQFAGIDIHIKIVELLHLIKPYFKRFKVIDEGEFWVTKDKKKLENRFHSCFRALKEELDKLNKKGVSYQSPVRVNKRIMDIISG